MLNRREILTAAVVAGLLPALSPAATTPKMRRIPASGELLPVIGLGTSRTFDVGADAAARDALLPACQEFVSLGGRVVDSSPMYGSAESVTGYLLSRIKTPDKPFVATKVWTTGKEAGETQMRASIEQLGTGQIDLMQVHNLVDWRTQLATLRDWKAAGKIRYIGITTSRAGQYADFEAVMRAEPLDFVQLNYSAGEREAEQTLLPLALERNMAVLVNRPYMRGELFKRVRGKPLPGWAADYRCDSWGQLFLNFALSHPAVTCLIPATSSLRHMTDNMGAGFAREPDAAFRQRLLAEIA
jgi:aryl-alcohol dehydrogenase-like predicted oxidoreductase